MRSIVFIFLLLCSTTGEAAGAREPEFLVTIKGHPETGAKEPRIPYQQATTFQIVPRFGLVRYRLAGFDSDWMERSGEMFLLVRFINSNGDQIAQNAFLKIGRSAGWNGSVESSVFIRHRETLTVPPGADNIVIAFSSAGPATSVGTFAVEQLEVSATSDDVRRALISPDEPVEWVKGGTRPSMTSTLPGKDGNTIHVITDDDITGHADWNTIATPNSRVRPGEKLELSWQDCFCTGTGNPFTITYDKLPAGSYRFEVDSLGFSGLLPGERRTVAFRINPPYWQDPWYWAALLLVVSGITVWVARRLVRKRIQMHLREARLISDERLRIARDLHDGLGARISHISLLGSHAMGSARDEGSKRIFGEISSMSRELVTSLSETVWMLNPKNDLLDSLVDYLCRMVSDSCRSLDIRCRIDADPTLTDREISGDFRHHVTLAVKEAVNNALKHSGCTEIRLGIHVTRDALSIRIEDNGSGLNAGGNEQGNGLENIRQRMDVLKGAMELKASAGAGVSIRMHVPLG
jgi:signal transduction histidine kinase